MIDVMMSALIAMLINAAAPDLPPGKAFEYARIITRESRKNDIDPQIIVAVTWHESGFRNLPVNATNDRGLMQLHWYPGSIWLKKLKPSDLMNPSINIRAGVHELAFWKKYHEDNCTNSHEWFAHYKWGYKVKNKKYGKAIVAKNILLTNSIRGNTQNVAQRNDSQRCLTLLCRVPRQPARASANEVASVDLRSWLLRRHNVPVLRPILTRNWLFFHTGKSRTSPKKFSSAWGFN